MVHRPRLILRFPKSCTGGNCEYCFCLVFFIKIVLCQQSRQTTIPYHMLLYIYIYQCYWLVQLAKNRKQKYFIDLNPGAHFENKCNVRG